MVAIRPASPEDAAEWVRMRCALWSDGTGEHRYAVDRFFAGHRHEPAEVLVALGEHGRPVGFAELSIRNIVTGCDSDRVAYLEGWYVDPEVRRQGIGAALIAEAQRWGLAKGCSELGSDALIDNEVSHRAHSALGFEEVDRVVNFRKNLGPSAPAT